MNILQLAFYQRENVVLIAKELLGKMLFTQFNRTLTGGIIIETEAYAGITDRASHAFGNKRTARTKVMYSKGGTAYIYLCYGVHSLFNVVTNKKDIPDAVLIRAIKPVVGVESMLQRSGKKSVDKDFGTGPGKVSKILGIHFSYTGIDLTIKPSKRTEEGIWLEDAGINILPEKILTGPRVGVDYAGQDAFRLYRFRIII
ncbi:MAG: DNA-3-methyladenine glycosylase [Bacteroidales bacterium]|jgi:DNA-3-methyladenine glycosylase